MTSQELHAAFVAKLKASGLTLADAKALGFEPYLEEEAKKRFPDFPQLLLRSGFDIPYRNLDGKANGFARWRNLDLTPRGLAAQTVEGKKGPPKYLQAADSCAEIFLPFLPRMKRDDWKKWAADVEQPLLTTEGELKAACAVKYDFPTFAIGGVDAFTSKRHNRWLLKSFSWFRWERREVHVILDSDAATNPKVLDAGNRYCARLSATGARLFLVVLPALPGVKKVGLDDFLLHREGGPKCLVELMKKTDEWEQTAELWDMNEIAVYVRQVSQVYVPEEDVFLKPPDFINNYRTRTYTIRSGEGAKLRMEEKILPKEWLGWPHRRECARVTFDPTAPVHQISPTEEFNMFAGLPLTPKAGDFAPWTELIDWMFNDARDAQDWFLNWAAYPLQCIAASEEPKMHSCAALISPQQGTGKGLVGQTLGALYGPAFASITTRELASEYNDWAKNRLFILGNEITGEHANKYADDLKEFVTESTFWLHAKYVRRIKQPNHMNLLFTSNHTDAFFVSFSDRRFFVHCAPERKLLDVWSRSRVDAYAKWYQSPEGQAALLRHLLDRRIPSSWDHRSPLDTPAKFAMQESSANTAENWLREIAAKPELLEPDLQKRLFWTVDELLALFKYRTGNDKYSAVGMGQALHRAAWFHVNHGNQNRWLGTPERRLKKTTLWSLPGREEEARKIGPERAVAKKYNEDLKLAKIPGIKAPVGPPDKS
jgi:uncharacterized protein DUF5906/uncharacterized protein DUF3854